MRKERGITLIALVVTIVVLLILAGVSIQMLTGDNGVITQAQKSKENTRIGELEEAVNLWKQERMIAKTTGGTPKTMEEILEELVERGALTDEEAEKIINDENNEIKIGDKTISFKSEIEVVEPENINDWEHTVEDDDTITITSYKGTDTELVIPNYINGMRVKKISPGRSIRVNTAFYLYSFWGTDICEDDGGYLMKQNTITKITISRGIENIDDSIFFNSIALNEINIPKSVTNMGENVFKECSNLTTINLEASAIPDTWNSNWKGDCTATVNTGVPM